MRKSIADILMERDGMTEKEAIAVVQEGQRELHERIAAGEMPFDFCEQEFGLEPDYLDELIC